MTDLNLWRLAYDSTVLDFGTLDSGHPFTRQVKIGPAVVETEDLAHPMSDAVLPGVDRSRGRTLEFAGAHLTGQPIRYAASRRWVTPMDLHNTFEQAWRARAVRETAGKVASLTSVDRGRTVYGRPRVLTPDHDRVRGGWLTYECAFDTVDDRFYGSTDKVVTTGVDARPAAAFTFPVTFPFTGVTDPVAARAWLVNAGTDDTWPVVTFRGGTRPRVDMLDGAGETRWWLSIDAVLRAGDVVEVDCRPWRRTVRFNRAARPGVLRGSRIDACRIPAGASEVKLTATDVTGQAEVEVRWRDAFGAW